MIIALTFVFTTILTGFATISAIRRYAENGTMHGGEAVVHATVIAVGLVGSGFVPILLVPAMVSLAFFAPQTW